MSLITQRIWEGHNFYEVTVSGVASDITVTGMIINSISSNWGLINTGLLNT